MTTITENTVNREEQAVKFFREIKNDLGAHSTQKIVKLVRAVLSQLRKSFSHDQASAFIKKMPSLFQLLFVTNWRYEEEQNSIKHLDELVDEIYQQDKKSSGTLFSSEVDALNAVIVVLRKLDKFFGIIGLNVLHYPLTQELKQAAIEDAA
ncbi:DUF2267 domain-containing protein [Chryseolinea lacunae]|uniref:DUF2267 domain-containing protein n=1 Tax=Chryseolinea lacunae TaxID=2801331 RepID=A0ABS1L0A9_9BACT|nr:DUF2267 domain-containing protein [Chryseolinea lacunae]MBL0745119.1 DUF2267 domain-containing protein [Chryseolinea lacunae]